jgi:phosphoribosylformylglycinamidine (FGAM) synthase PurS component
VQVEAADAAAAEATVREVSGTLLANPVIESFRVDTPTPVA